MPTIAEVLNTLQNSTNTKISQSDIARALNLTRATISKRAKTNSELTFQELKILEKFFNINFSNRNIENTLERCFDNKIDDKIDGIGNRLLELKNKNNMSDLKLAALLDISESELTSIITGKTLPDWRVIKNLKQNFKVSIDWLLFGE